MAAMLLAAGAARAEIPTGMAEVKLEAHDVTGFGSIGFQWLLDSSHSSCNEWFFPTSRMYFGDYSHFDYKVPENAAPAYDVTMTVVDGTVSLYIPAGIYDWMVAQPDPDGTWLVLGDMTRVDDFTFLPGETYHMTISERDGDEGWGFYGTLGVATDLALTNVAVPAPSATLGEEMMLGVSIANLGTEDMKDFRLTYSINGGEPVSETYGTRLPAGTERDYFFSTPADLSAPGKYEIVFTVEADGDMIASNNSMSATTRHMIPVDLPYECDFSHLTPEDFLEEWYVCNNSADGAGWNYSEWKENKNGEMGAVYCQSPYMTDADDWMFSPALDFKAGKGHVLFSACNIDGETPEYLEVYLTRTTADFDRSQMTLAGEFTVRNSEWGDKAVNFDVPEDGIYYVAFRGVSPSTSLSLNIGDVSIGEGEFVGTPMIQLERLLVPYSNCDLSAESRLGLRVTNMGTAPLKDYTLTAWVGQVRYTTDFTEPVMPDETVDLYMDRTFDFTKTGEYPLQFILSADDMDDISAETVVECLEPLSELPVTTNFSHDINTEIWQAMSEHSWSYEPMFEVFSSETTGKENGLLSRGVNLSYPARFKISYMAPGWDTGKICVYMGLASEDPLSYGLVFSDEDVASEAKEAEFVAPVTGPGNYSFIISDEAPADSRNRLRLNQVDISEVYAKDVALTDVEGSLAPYTPEKSLKGEHLYNVTVLNRGSEVMGGIVAVAYLNGKMIADSANALKLAPGESGILPLLLNIPEMKAGDSFELTFELIAGDDQFPADNKLTLPLFNVTGSTFAHEQLTDLTYGTGLDGQTLSVGYIYTLPDTSDATGMTVGFAVADDEDIPNVKADVEFNVYRLSADGSVDRCLWSETRTRGMGGMTDIDFPDMRLEPGTYFFEVVQASPYNMGIANDIDNATTVYSRVDDKLMAVPAYPVCIRAEFADGAIVYTTDASVLNFTAPVYDDGLYSEATTVKAVARNAGYENTEFKVELTLDGAAIGEETVSLLPYESKELTFKGVDLSKEGHHTLMASAIQSGDLNHTNNSATLTINAVAEADPYLMDFENCADFSATGDPWNPRWTTVDRNGVETDNFWRYSYPHKGEPVGFIAFNIAATEPSMYDEAPLEGFFPHSGERFGVAFHINSWAEGAEDLEESDVWIISPKLQLGTGSEFDLYVKTRMLESDFSELEPYRILVSETDTEPESFTILGDEQRQAAVDWENVTVDLSEYDGKSVYVALQYVGRPRANVCLMIDDLHVKTTLPSYLSEVRTESPVRVSGHDIIAPSGSSVFTPDGLETGFSNLPAGIYIVKTPSQAVKVMIP